MIKKSLSYAVLATTTLGFVMAELCRARPVSDGAPGATGTQGADGTEGEAGPPGPRASTFHRAAPEPAVKTPAV